MIDHKIIPAVMQTGERSIRISFGDEISDETFQQIKVFGQLIRTYGKFEIEDVVPSYTTVHVYFHSNTISPIEWAHKLLENWNEIDLKTNKDQPYNHIQIPVCYEEEFALDIQKVMKHTSLTHNEMINLHTAPAYAVHAIGFLPGFPYLGGLHPRLATPRLEVPRERLGEGTVGIGGAQTGVYPVSSPGGWNIIGRTPLSLYQPKRKIPFLCKAGDIVRFQAISVKQFWEIKRDLEQNPDDIQHWVTRISAEDNRGEQ
ncbi:5-oxoprolinase subunit PxpB [Cytobacillus gottheilii]|uniref:5-oxoprolinase subunit PxpB n=1 Tax=Cytobacillus gottheilii TaxID=859144 RepID=UPI003CF389ED